MSTAAELLRQGRRDEVWKKYCGFLDLSLQEFMAIQERLLMEQIELLSRCELGRQFFAAKVPTSVGEFQEVVPLTTYHNYIPYLTERRDEILPSKPAAWARTSGRSSVFDCKWAPYSKEMVNKVGEFVVAAFILSSCSGRGDVRINEYDTCLYTLAPPPYFTGAIIARGLADQLHTRFIPSLELGDKMDYGERIQEGFKQALKSGIDLFYGLSSVLVAVAKQFEQGSSSFQPSLDMFHPRFIYRVTKGMAKSRLNGRGLYPKDLWKVKGIVAGGMDTAIYSDTIEAYWGRKPLEGYGGTELAGIALQAWNFKGLNFLPDFNFLEFIDEEDFYRSRTDPEFQPHTRRLDQLEPGVYELVISNFHGGAFTRYRTGDLIEITALSDPELDIALPQMAFHARADGVIDIAGFTRLTEKAVWQAIEESDVSYTDWMVRKEYQGDKPFLHLYLETTSKNGRQDVQEAIHESLKEKDPGYAELESMLGLNPLKVTRLAPGTFAHYTEQQRTQGAELAHMKPPRINPSQEVVNRILGP
jgi:hypothetical protein